MLFVTSKLLYICMNLCHSLFFGACRRPMQRSGQDFSILLVLPAGVYHYKFIVDGEWRYVPELPFIADETGRVCNLLDVHVCIYHNLGYTYDFLLLFIYYFVNQKWLCRRGCCSCIIHDRLMTCLLRTLINRLGTD